MHRNLALLFDRTYLKIAPNKTCNNLLENDAFDGKIYSIDDFNNYIKEYFGKPQEFYKKKQGFDVKIEESQEERNEYYSKKYFKSPIKTDWENNNRVPLYHYTKKKHSNVLLIFAHGWARPNIFAENLICRKLLKRGIDSIIPIVPYHMERAPENSMSGEYFISANMYWTIMNFRHFANELIEIIEYYKKNYKYVGLIGMSSGGFQAGLAITSIPVDFYFPFITGSKLGSITWSGKLTSFVKRDLIKKGVSEDELNIVWGIADQENVGQHCKANYIKQFISLYDEIVPTRYQYLLWEKYNKPDKVELKCGHNSSIFCFNVVVNEITKSVKNYL